MDGSHLIRLKQVLTASLALLAGACCEERPCARRDVVATARGLAGEATDCGTTDTRAEEEILRCIDEAEQNGRGYFFSARGGDTESGETFVETMSGDHYRIVLAPGGLFAELFRCPKVSTDTALPSCDPFEEVFEEISCESETCKVDL